MVVKGVGAKNVESEDENVEKDEKGGENTRKRNMGKNTKHF